MASTGGANARTTLPRATPAPAFRRTWGNTTSYAWAEHGNRYQANGSAPPGDPRSLKAYDAGGRLLQVAWPGGWADLRWGSRFWDGTAFVEEPDPVADKC